MHNNNENTYIPDMPEKKNILINVFITTSMKKTIEEIQELDDRESLSETIRVLIKEGIRVKRKNLKKK